MRTIERSRTRENRESREKELAYNLGKVTKAVLVGLGLSRAFSPDAAQAQAQAQIPAAPETGQQEFVSNVEVTNESESQPKAVELSFTGDDAKYTPSELPRDLQGAAFIQVDSQKTFIEDDAGASMEDLKKVADLVIDKLKQYHESLSPEEKEKITKYIIKALGIASDFTDQRAKKQGYSESFAHNPQLFTDRETQARETLTTALETRKNELEKVLGKEIKIEIESDGIQSTGNLNSEQCPDCDTEIRGAAYMLEYVIKEPVAITVVKEQLQMPTSEPAPAPVTKNITNELGLDVGVGGGLNWNLAGEQGEKGEILQSIMEGEAGLRIGMHWRPGEGRWIIGPEAQFMLREESAAYSDDRILPDFLEDSLPPELNQLEAGAGINIGYTLGKEADGVVITAGGEYTGVRQSTDLKSPHQKGTAFAGVEFPLATWDNWQIKLVTRGEISSDKTQGASREPLAGGTAWLEVEWDPHHTKKINNRAN